MYPRNFIYGNVFSTEVFNAFRKASRSIFPKSFSDSVNGVAIFPYTPISPPVFSLLIIFEYGGSISNKLISLPSVNVFISSLFFSTSKESAQRVEKTGRFNSVAAR